MSILTASRPCPSFAWTVLTTSCSLSLALCRRPPVEEGCLHHSDGSPLFYPWTSAATRDRFAGKTPACPLKKVSTARQRSKVPSRKSTAATSSGNRGREGMPGPTNAGGQYMYARRTHGGLIELDPRPEITEWYINRWLYCRPVTYILLTSV